MDKFVQKKPKLGDGNLLKIERGDKLKEIAGLSAADYDLKWSERPNEIKFLQPHPGISTNPNKLRIRGKVEL